MRAREEGAAADPRNLTASHPPPPPSPAQTWADVLRGGVRRRGEELPRPTCSWGLPTAPSTTNTPLPSPSALDQFRAWLCCKERGVSARLVLETQFGEEEISFWCKTAVATAAANIHQGAPKRQRSERRREQERRRRKARAQRRKEATVDEVSGKVAAVVSATTDTTDSATLSVSPSATEPSAKRVKRAAAVKASALSAAGLQRRRPLFPPPELSRGKGFQIAALATDGGDEEVRVRDPSLGSPLPPSSPPQQVDEPVLLPGLVTTGNTCLDTTLEVAGGEDYLNPPSPLEESMDSAGCEKPFDEDFDEDEWEDGRRLNTCNPPWTTVFPLNRKRCRFCRRLPPEPDGDGDCEECDKFTTFQLVKKYAPRWHYPKES